MPPAVALVGFVKLAGFVVFAYYFALGRARTWRGLAAFVLFMAALLGFYAGFTLSVLEDSRLRDGHVVSGVVVEMYLPVGRGKTITTRGREGPKTGGSAYLMSEALGHWLAYGSVRTLMVDYHYPCSAGRGTCSSRDLVSPDLWSRLTVGQRVNVRQGADETVTARLDENPQITVALAEMGIAVLFFAGAGLLSGRLRLPLRPGYVAVEAVVTAVEEVKGRGATRWNVRFAYFDRNGHAQESVAEVAQPAWRPGDACEAVYLRETPGVATLTGAGV